MATKKNSIPKTIEYRGLILHYNKFRGDYADKLGSISARQHSIDSWSAMVEIGAGGGVSEEAPGVVVHAPTCAGISYGLAKTYQEAIDLAVDNAIEAIATHIRWLTNDKDELSNLRKTGE